MASPVVDVVIPNQTDTAGESVNLDVSSNFSDADVTDAITYSVTSGLPVGTGLSIDPTTGVLSGTITQEDVDAGPLSVVLRATDSVGFVEVTKTLDVASPPPVAAQTYYINGTSGSDGSDGLTPETAWATIGKANASVIADPSGNVNVLITPGTYPSDPISTQAGGTDDDHRIIYDSSDGSIASVFITDTDTAVDINHSYVTVGQGIISDGEINTPSPLSANVNHSANATGSAVGVILECSAQNTVGWEGAQLAADGLIWRNATVKYVGSPDGDTPQVDRSDGITWKGDDGLMDNLYTSDIGHYHVAIEGQRVGMVNGDALINWDTLGLVSSVATGELPLGNHCISMNSEDTAPFATDNWVYNYSFRNQGVNYQDDDKDTIRATKAVAAEGDRALVNKCWMINDSGFAGMSGACSISSRTKTGASNDDVRIAHVTATGLQGAAIWANRISASTLTGLQIKNCCFKDCSQADQDGTDAYLYISLKNAEVPEIVAGNLFPSDAVINVPNVKSDTIAGWESSHPSVFFDNIIETGNSGVITFANEGAASTTPANREANYQLDSASDGVDGGVDLTTASGAGVSSTALTAVDASWFRDGWDINVGGTEVAIDTISGNAITLATAISWSDADGINISHTGTAPNCGASQ